MTTTLNTDGSVTVSLGDRRLWIDPLAWKTSGLRSKIWLIKTAERHLLDELRYYGLGAQ